MDNVKQIGFMLGAFTTFIYLEWYKNKEIEVAKTNEKTIEIGK